MVQNKVLTVAKPSLDDILQVSLHNAQRRIERVVYSAGHGSCGIYYVAIDYEKHYAPILRAVSTNILLLKGYQIFC